MALKPRLTARQSQRLSLTPSIRQGMAVLQMPTLDLGEELRRQADENPLLEIRDPTPAGFDPEFMRNLSPGRSLAAHLREQIIMMSLAPEVSALAQILAGDLDENGYLSVGAEGLAQELNIPEEAMTAAVTALQSCEPVGVAARNLLECLTLQLTEKGVPGPVARTACANLNLLMEGRWAQAMQKIGQSEKELRRLAKLVRTLHPRPAAQFAEAAQPIAPEVLIEADGQGGFVVSHLDATLPVVTLDSVLAAQVGASGPLHDRLLQAKGLIGALRFRGGTLCDIARRIVHHQHLFFSEGRSHMQPLTRAQVAQELGLHPATVGRAVAGKALLFQGATLPFATFFPANLGKGASAYTVQQRIKALIDDEKGDSVLSDEEIATFLQREGVDIARRTVAKYRKCMNIPSSFQRKRLRSPSGVGSAPKGLGSPEKL